MRNQGQRRPPHVATRACVLLFALTPLLGACATDGGKCGEFRVMSWNVARGYGLNPPVLGAMLPRRLTTAGALEDDERVKAADVIALQEVCGEADAHDVGWFAAALGTPHVYFKRADPDRVGACKEGLALISRWPIVKAGSLLLPAMKPMRKTAIWVDVRIPSERGGRLVRVWNVHMDHSTTGMTAPEGRRLQLAPVLAQIAEVRGRAHDRGLVLVGDFNTLQAREPVVDDAAAVLVEALADDQATHVLGWRLDHLFFGGLLRREAKVVTLPGSDHFAIMADFDLPPQASEFIARERRPTVVAP